MSPLWHLTIRLIFPHDPASIGKTRTPLAQFVKFPQPRVGLKSHSTQSKSALRADWASLIRFDLANHDGSQCIEPEWQMQIGKSIPSPPNGGLRLYRPGIYSGALFRGEPTSANLDTTAAGCSGICRQKCDEWSNCGTGARQISELYVNGDDLAKIRKHRAIGTGFDHILVDGGMVKKLKDAGITGISFGDVRARLKNDKWTSVARDQILIEHIMPPMRVAPTEYDEKYLCKVCRRGGRMSSLGNIYRDEDLVGSKDFNLTWEGFGEFRTADHPHGAHRSCPNILVTPKVMNIFRDAGVKTFDWLPVDIET